MQRAVLLYIKNQTQVCLGMKKRGLNQGKWTGIGGKLEPGEDWISAVIRETQEEISCQLAPHLLTWQAELTFHSPAGKWLVRVYLTSQPQLLPQESQEIKPQWFEIGHLPYSQMPRSDSLWLPAVLSQFWVKGSFYYLSDDQLSQAKLEIKASHLSD